MMTASEVAHRMAITDVIHRYCRAMDRIDAELGYSVWHEGGEADYGAIFNGSGRDFIDWVCGVHRTMLATSHRATNLLITLDGDHARSETSVSAVLRHMDAGRLMQTMAWGRYLDRWSRRSGRWAIDRRIYVHDFDEMRECSTSGTPVTGRRGREDPSYQVMTA